MQWESNNGNLTETDMKKIAHNMQIIENGQIDKKVVDDTVYMTIKANFRDLQKDSGKGFGTADERYSFPMSFDISSLGLTGTPTLYTWYWRTGKTSSTWGTDSNANRADNRATTFSSPFRYTQDAYEKILAGGFTLKLIVTDQDVSGTANDMDSALAQLKKANPNAKYICYVVTFVQS